MLFLASMLGLMFITPVYAIDPLEISDDIEDLIETIESWNLHKGTRKSLTSKLESVIHLLNKGNNNGAKHKLMDFMNQVEALRVKKLTNEQADYLTSEAQRILTNISLL